jgi:hypothetical protein
MEPGREQRGPVLAGAAGRAEHRAALADQPGQAGHERDVRGARVTLMPPGPSTTVPVMSAAAAESRNATRSAASAALA